MSKKLFQICVAAAASVMLMQSTVFAAPVEYDMDYTGPINSVTGEPTTTATRYEGSDRVRIASDMEYDVDQDMFIFSSGSNSQYTVASTVADGMITTHMVSIYPSDGLVLDIYFNGTLLTDADITAISEPGEYVVTRGMNGESFERLFAFTIISELTNQARQYTMPEGFQITAATLNGQRVDYTLSSISFTGEGEYNVKYRCVRTNRDYQLIFTADFTAPVLKLEAVVDGLAKGPVDLSDLEEGCAIAIACDGEVIGVKEKLTSSGEYIIKVADPAGNIRTYQFTIGIYFDSNSFVFFALVVGSIVAVIGYVLLSRKRLRVR